VHAGLRLENGLVLAGRYRLDTVIGSGTGDVWRAFDQRLNRPVAIRLLPGDPLSARPAAEAAAALRHPGITAILDIAQHESSLLLVTELLDGQDLGSALARQPGGLPIAQVAAVAVKVSAALATAHAQGLVHGGLKPGDIFLQSDGGVKTSGFGVLRRPGTERYPAPEQGPADQRADLYSLGGVLFEAVTGRQPQSGPPVPVTSLRPDVPEYLDRLLLSLQAIDPGSRPPSASAVNDFLRASGAEAVEPIIPLAPATPSTSATTVADTAPRMPTAGGRRQFALGAVSGVVAAAVVGGGVFLGLHATSSSSSSGSSDSSGSSGKHHTRPSAPSSGTAEGPEGPQAPGAMSPTSPPLVAGWKPAWSTAHGIIYEVPANWKVEAPDTFVGEADATGNTVLRSFGVAAIENQPASGNFCTLVQSGVTSGTGLGLGLGSPSDSALTSSLDSLAATTAADWADFSFTNSSGTLPKVSLGGTEHITIDGQAASIVAATATERGSFTHDWCHPPSGVVDAVAMHSRSGANIAFYVLSDEGIPGGLSQDVMHQIIKTIRPLG
jgi:serine/threonine protein kinase